MKENTLESHENIINSLDDKKDNIKLTIKDTESNIKTEKSEKTENKLIRYITNDTNSNENRIELRNKKKIKTFLTILDSVKNDIKNINDFEQFIKKYKKDEEDEYNTRILSKSKILIYFSFNFFGPIFVILNLLSIYHIFSLMDALIEEFKDSFSIIILKRKREYSFYQHLKIQSYRVIPELDIMLFSSIIGDYFLNAFSLFFTFIFFYIVILLLLFLSSFFHYNKGEKLNDQYTASEISILFILFFFFYIFVGAISMLSVKQFIEGYNKYIIKQYGKKYKNKFNLIILSITCSLAIILKMVINKIFITKIFNYSIESNNYLVSFGGIFLIIYGLSFIFLYFYQLAFKGNEKKKNVYYVKNKSSCLCLGYVFYSENVKKIKVYGKCPEKYEVIKTKDDIIINKSFCTFFKIQNAYTWFIRIFKKTDTLFFMGINFGLKFQIIALDDLLKDKLEKKFSDNKVLIVLGFYISFQFIVNVFSNILVLIIYKLCFKNKKKEKENYQNYFLLCNATIISSIVSLIFSIIFYFTNFLKKKRYYFYLIQLGLNSVTQNSLFNEFISNDGINFLSTTSFLSFTNIIFEIINFAIELFDWPSTKILVILQIVFSSSTLILSIFGLVKKFNIDFTKIEF